MEIFHLNGKENIYQLKKILNFNFFINKVLIVTPNIIGLLMEIV
jgi:hypothetical protein